MQAPFDQTADDGAVKRPFAQRVASEIRSALNAVHGLTEILSEPLAERNFSARERRPLKALQSSTHQLAEWVELLLELVSAEPEASALGAAQAEGTQLNPEPSPVLETFEQLIAVHARAAHKRGAELTLAMDWSIPSILRWAPAVVEMGLWLLPRSLGQESPLRRRNRSAGRARRKSRPRLRSHSSIQELVA